MNWLYIGRAGHDMNYALRVFFHAVRRALENRVIDSDRLQISLMGTDYAPSGPESRWSDLAAREAGIEHLVSERPRRLAYVETLKRLTAADALFMPGSDDPGYTASKVYPYILAQRPLW